MKREVWGTDTLFLSFFFYLLHVVCEDERGRRVSAGFQFVIFCSGLDVNARSICTFCPFPNKIWTCLLLTCINIKVPDNKTTAFTFQGEFPFSSLGCQETRGVRGGGMWKWKCSYSCWAVVVEPVHGALGGSLLGPSTCESLLLPGALTGSPSALAAGELTASEAAGVGLEEGGGFRGVAQVDQGPDIRLGVSLKRSGLGHGAVFRRGGFGRAGGAGGYGGALASRTAVGRAKALGNWVSGGEQVCHRGGGVGSSGGPVWWGGSGGGREEAESATRKERKKGQREK